MIRIVCYGIFLFLLFSQTFALSDPSTKTNKSLYLKSANLVREPPSWFQPVDLRNAPEDINHWLKVLPFEQDRYHQRYIVIPQLGAIAPVVTLDPTSVDYKAMFDWEEININKYLTRGVLQYAWGVQPWHQGHFTIFGHSNFLKNGAWDYKTVFGSIFYLDPDDQVWIYDRNSDGSYTLYKYLVTASYLTTPNDTGILLWDGNGAEMTVFACAHGLDYRRVIKTAYIGDPIVPYKPVAGLDQYYLERLESAVKKIFWLPDAKRGQAVVYLQNVLARAKRTNTITLKQQELIEILNFYLPQLLP